MFQLIGNNKKLIIILHEIYGLNRHIRYYAECFFEAGYDVLCPNFIQREEAFAYENEQPAYAHFIEHVGFENVFKEVSSLIRQEREHYEEIHVIGFSIGATVAWLCSSMEEVTTVSGYYGSRIRDYLYVQPKCPVLLIYGEEISFDVKKLAGSLTMKNVLVHVIDGSHGFADPYAPAFHEKSSKAALSLIHSFIQT